MRSLSEIAREASLSEDQLRTVEDQILSHGEYTEDTVREELDWFCTQLGMADYYFRTTSLEDIASHIAAIKAAEITAKNRKDQYLVIDLQTESKDEALYLVDDDHARAIEIERRIEERYPHYRVQSYRTSGKAGGEHLRMYLVYKPTIVVRRAQAGVTDLKRVACQEFLENTSQATFDRYQAAMDKARDYETPLIEVGEKPETGEHRIMILVDRDSSFRFFSNISDVFNSHGLASNRKYIEQFANGKTAIVLYLDRVESAGLLEDLVEDISLVYVISDSPLTRLFRSGDLNAQETVFGVSAWSFAHQFLYGFNEEYLKLAEALKDSPELLGILRRMKTKLARDTYTEDKVWDTFLEHSRFIKRLFKVFDRKFNPGRRKHEIDQEIAEVERQLRSQVPTEIDRTILEAVITFIKVCQRTNFYKREKTSIAFMYDPVFLNPVDYPERPFGIIHIVGMEFRGFHVRFRDIARGGIRLVRSSNFQKYINNSDFIFDENYDLASTQQRKNKDIPEGGSKGTILLGWEYQDSSEAAFKKYLDGLLDLLLPDPDIVDYYGEEVILFLGPDEGTAELMAWASLRAKALGYPYWKAFSTGKPVEMGGIPHDLYGMTTNSVHQFVLNILERKKLREASLTKVMTGGPDGDLGSNEILISKDRILAVVDGSGVAYDPDGLDRDELERLARERSTIEHFDRERLSKRGFFVHVDDEEVTLPDGQYVANGMEFRDFFHLDPRFRADLFVPCGGRPSSININNWDTYVDNECSPRFRIISEGANLFLTQDARLRLEENGVIIYKDASANKGGVTSSSLEVLASLALSDDEYDQNMRVIDGVVPEFRARYVEEILGIIRGNATYEFHVIEKEHEAKGLPRVRVTDLLSDKINAVTDAVFSSPLIENEALFRHVLRSYIPEVLVDMVGFDEIIARVPDAYLRSVFSSRLASRYVYTCGLDANEIDFHGFVAGLSV